MSEVIVDRVDYFGWLYAPNGRFRLSVECSRNADVFRVTRKETSMFKLITITLAALLVSATIAQADEAAEFYANTCVACHGATGGGDGVAAAALKPPPASFKDPAFWKTRDDATVKKAIKEGGAAVGKSPTMAALGAGLSDAQLDALVTYLKTFKTK